MKKILIVEDNVDLAENIELLIKEHKFKTMSCHNGRDALEYTIGFNPDIILCDIMLPDISGYKFLVELKKVKNRNMPIVIFITAKTQRVDIRKGMLLGADDYLTKPFTHEELISSINVQLNKREKLFKSNDLIEDGRQSNKQLPEPRNSRRALLKEGDGNYNSYFFVNDKSSPGFYLIHDLIMIKSLKDYTQLYFINGRKCILRKSMIYWENKLPSKYFLRIHRQVIINVECIEETKIISSNRFLLKLKYLSEKIEVSQRYSHKIKKLS
jgi:DNA-binding LytR/AlgR family response regulator